MTTASTRRCRRAWRSDAAFAAVVSALLWHGAAAAPATSAPPDPAPCMAAAAAGDNDAIIAACSVLIDNDTTEAADRIKALVARAGAYARKDLTDRAIDDDTAALRLDPQRADFYNARGELRRKNGDRRGALQDFAAALKLDTGQAAAKANTKSLALELERLGALLAVNNKPSFNCATARRAVEKAICASPDLANLDRQINAVNTQVVGDAARADPRDGRALQREQDDFIARRNAEFGRPDYDLAKAMRERLDHLLAIGRH